MDFTLFAYPFAILTGGIAGAVNAIAGGGTFLTFPTLTGVTGLSEKVANMTSTTGVWPGAASSIFAAREDFKKIPRRMIVIFALVSLVGGICGSLLLLYTKASTFRLVIPWLLGFATLLFAFSKPISQWSARHGAHAGHTSKRWTVIVSVIQFGVAIYGGYFGAGIGVLMLAGLSFAGLETLNQINALKVLLNAIINGITIAIFLMAPLFHISDRIDWPVALGMGVLAAIGGFVGMQIARKMKPAKLRAIILTIGVLLTAFYFYKVYFAG